MWTDTGMMRCQFVIFWICLSSKCENKKNVLCEAWKKSLIHTHHSQYIKLHGNTIHIICTGTVIADEPQILALVRSFVFLFGFTQVRFNFIDDVISLYEVG